MPKLKASLDFVNLSTGDKPAFGGNVVTCLTANASVFANLPVSLEELTLQNRTLTVAFENYQNGGKQQRAALNKALAAWQNAFELTANYVSLVANGNQDTIVISGFDATKGTRQRAPEPGTLKNFHAIAPKATGVIDISCDADTTSHGYIAISSQEEGATITQNGNQLSITAGGITTNIIVSTRSRARFTNMPTGKTQYLSIFAFNASGAGPLTNGQQAIPQ